jgi:hypothetical protein
MGGRYWRDWSKRAFPMYLQHQRTSPPELTGSWDPDQGPSGGGRLFSTCMATMALETPYRFSPLMLEAQEREK